MPRRRPGAIRAELRYPPGRPTAIPGLSAATCAAIDRAELRPLRMYSTAHVLGVLRRFLRTPSRWLYLTPSTHPCCDDGVIAARDQLADMHRALPARARREFAVVLARLDAELWRRTIPAPGPWRRRLDPGDPGWWHQRLRGE